MTTGKIVGSIFQVVFTLACAAFLVLFIAKGIYVGMASSAALLAISLIMMRGDLPFWKGVWASIFGSK